MGWSGVGHVLRFMWTCRWRTCYAVAAGRCMYSWVVLAFQLRKSRSSKVLGRTGSTALTKRRLKTCEDEVVSGSAKDPKMLVSCRRNTCFRETACEYGVNDLKKASHKFLLARAHQHDHNIPWATKNPRPSKGRAPSYCNSLYLLDLTYVRMIFHAMSG